MQIDNAVRLLLKVCHLIHAKGLVSGSGGNLNVRCGDKILITPSGRSLQMLKEDDLIHLSMDGSFWGKNGGVPSKEWRMHLACYQRGDVGAVAHVHSVYAVAAACLERTDAGCALPVYTPGYAARVGKLPKIPYYKSGSPELCDAVSAVIQERNSVLLANHGVLTVGRTMEDALNLVEDIEENAKMYFVLDGGGVALSEEQQALLPPMGMRAK